jgi:hypothetical protein
VLLDRDAHAFDRLPDNPHDEFRRKVRTLSGNFQLLARLPALLLPWRNPVWFQLMSHKLMRLVVPWALLAMIACCALLLEEPLYRGLLMAQGCCYLLGVVGLLTPDAVKTRLTAAAASFLVLNAAAWLAFWVWISGRADKSWRKVQYRESPVAAISHRP